MRVTSNKTIDFLRLKERNPQNYGEHFQEEDFSHSAQNPFSEPAENFAKADNQNQVKALMQSLPIEQRLVVELKFFQQFTFEEISMQLNVPTNTVKTRLYTALNTLKDQVGKQLVL